MLKMAGSLAVSRGNHEAIPFQATEVRKFERSYKAICELDTRKETVMQTLSVIFHAI